MPHFEPDFADVSAHYCPKPKCTATFLHRHHIEIPTIWINLGNMGLLSHPSWTPQLIFEWHNRYKAFLAEDVHEICAHHHAEIHFLCDKEIEKHQRSLNFKKLRDYSLDEALDLMKKMRETFSVWIRKETAGIDPKYIDALEKLPLVKDEIRHV